LRQVLSNPRNYDGERIKSVDSKEKMTFQGTNMCGYETLKRPSSGDWFWRNLRGGCWCRQTMAMYECNPIKKIAC
jgi:hypothetical protein